MNDVKFIKRPTRIDNEYDLLREQEAFLSSYAKEPISVKLVRSNKPSTSNQDDTDKSYSEQKFADATESARVIFDVMEKNVGNTTIKFPSPYHSRSDSGFPKVFKVDPHDRSVDGVCLFSKYLSKEINGGIDSKAESIDNAQRSIYTISNDADQTVSLTPLEIVKSEVHNENLRLLESMSESDVIQERDKLLNNLDPSLVKFLISKSQTKSSS